MSYKNKSSIRTTDPCPKCGEYIKDRIAYHIVRCEGKATNKPNKYNAKKTEVDGIVFDSKLEASRWEVLQLRLKAGQISELERQIAFDLHAGVKIRIGMYRADFQYLNANGEKIIEDTKGVETALFRWKKKHFEIEYAPQVIKIVKTASYE